MARRQGVLLLLCGVVFLVLALVGAFDPVKSLARGVMQWPTTGAVAIGESISTTSQLWKIGRLPSENAQLRAEVEQWKNRAHDVERLQQENEDLRAQLAFTEERGVSTVLARVAGRSAFADIQVVVVDAGSEDGVEKGQAVISPHGSLVGRVFTVSRYTSEVLLLTDANSAVDAVIQETGDRGIVEGDRGLGLNMSLLPSQSDPQPHQMVATSGASGLFPAGLLIGTIVGSSTSHTTLFNEAQLELAADIESLRTMFILVSSSVPVDAQDTAQ